MTKEYLTYISLFSGIGGFEKGIQESRYKDKLICTYYSEIDKYADSIYRRQFPQETRDGVRTHQPLGDITEVETADLPSFDLLVGGFPCQAFSVAGLRRGFDDTRGTLFFEIARVLKDKRPRYFLLENVKGLLGHDKGKTFQTILTILSSLGYDVKWEVLNSKNFGVPQNRERIYIKGYSRDRCGDEILSQRESGSTFDKEIGGYMNHNRSGRVTDNDGITGTLTSTGRNSGYNTFVKTGIKKVGNFSPSNHHGKNIYSSDGIAPTLCSEGVAKNGVHILDDDKLPTFQRVDENRSVTTTKDGDYFCLKTSHPIDKLSKRKSNFVIEKVLDENYSIRRLTPVECERLQGFPDNWTAYGADGEPISNTQRYKCCGNAVTVNVVAHIFNNWDLNV